uniref:gliding motility-associated C-terminal domain-containing protein n=1 Tax=uncultured Draconibacterium sp. TaxID=1573823 RepID=UPI003216AE3E
MKPYLYLASLFFFLVPNLTNAQNEASVWPLGSNKKINFQSGYFEVKDSELNDSYTASICDKDGNLLLYSDGQTIWNAKNEILINGTNLTEGNYHIIDHPIFVPHPQKEGHHLLFYVYVTKSNYTLKNKKLVYAEIDCNAWNKQGEVILKNEFLHDDFHDSPTIAGFCNNSFYWLAVDRNDNIHEPGRDQIYFYKIDKNGVHKTPKINGHFDMGYSGGYKFSPNGDKLFFGYGYNPHSGYDNIIADFNFLTGELYNYRILSGDGFSSLEFSRDSHLLYFFYGRLLIQADVEYSSFNKIERSKKIILVLPQAGSEYNGFGLQLAPDGRIYFFYTDPNTGNTKLGRINSPNNKGSSCDVELDIHTFKKHFYYSPKFVTSFFRDKQPTYIDEILPEVGTPLEICSRTSAKIGADGQSSAAFYKWFPDNEITEPFASATIITAPRLTGESQTKQYSLRTTDGNCWLNFDQINVIFRPQPKDLSLDGSWSVCPYVEKVDYWSDKKYLNAKWFVDGGEIVEKPTEDTVRIDWGDTNLNASIKSYRKNVYGCISDTAVFPVRINVELMTETPLGPQHLCLAQAKNTGHQYEIRKTNGSLYQWEATDGEIIEGQGSNRILVIWNKAGEHELSVKETSTTIDTICYGESVPLSVEVINDSLEVVLNSVSFDTNNNIGLDFHSESFHLSKHRISVLVYDITGNFIKETIGKIVYHQTHNELQSEIIQVKIINKCDEIFYSNKQQTIVLQATDLSTNDAIHLEWNNNQYWQNNRTENEIWHSLSKESGWELLGELNSATAYTYQNTGLQLEHYFRVKEKNQDSGDESWSNILNIRLEDNITIPNVFTPNGDGFNDVWEINNIRFHDFIQLTVFNRYGQKVFDCKNEFFPWDGKIDGEVKQGTYFYQLSIDNEETRHGQITVLQ